MKDIQVLEVLNLLKDGDKVNHIHFFKNEKTVGIKFITNDEDSFPIPVFQGRSVIELMHDVNLPLNNTLKNGMAVEMTRIIREDIEFIYKQMQVMKLYKRLDAQIEVKPEVKIKKNKI